MTNKQALREAAEKATPGDWRRASTRFNGITSQAVYPLCGKEEILANTAEKRDAEFIAAANPTTVLSLLDDLEAAEKRIAELERGSKVIKCWSCQKSVTIDQVTAEDGFCPSCNCGIDLEDYETA